MKLKEKFNTKIKIYPDGNFKVTYCNKFIFSNPNDDVDEDDLEDWEIELREIQEKEIQEKEKEKEKEKNKSNENEKIKNLIEFAKLNGVTCIDKDEQDKKTSLEDKDKIESNIKRSLKRAKDKVFDIVYINDFKYFVTVTFDPSQVDSSNAKEVIKKMRVWLNHQQQRLNIEYLLVPEYHKSGLIHCHLVITDYPDKYLERAVQHRKGGGVVLNKDGTPKLLYSSNGQPVYNLINWRYGWSTCIPIYRDIGSNFKLAHYITKYLTKDTSKIFGKYYWSSKGLKRDVNTEYFTTDYYSIPLAEYKVPNTNICLKYDSQFK